MEVTTSRGNLSSTILQSSPPITPSPTLKSSPTSQGRVSIFTISPTFHLLVGYQSAVVIGLRVVSSMIRPSSS